MFNVDGDGKISVEEFGVSALGLSGTMLSVTLSLHLQLVVQSLAALAGCESTGR